MTALPLYALDLETDTTRNGLDPHDAAIVSAAIYSGGHNGSGRAAIVFDDRDEARLLRSLDAWLGDDATAPGVIVTWNGAAFDIPFLLTRAEICDVKLGLAATVSEARKPYYEPINGHAGGYVASWYDHDHADVMHAWRSWARAQGIRGGLKPVASAQGIEVIEVDRTKIHELSAADLMAYNVSDVHATWLLAHRLEDLGPWLDSRV